MSRLSLKIPILSAFILCSCAGFNIFQDPFTAEEHMKLGISFEEQSLYSSAAKEYGAALRKEQNHVPALVALGNLAFKAGSLVEAEIYYRRVLRLAPEHASANN